MLKHGKLFKYQWLFLALFNQNYPAIGVTHWKRGQIHRLGRENKEKGIANDDRSKQTEASKLASTFLSSRTSNYE